MTVWFTLCSKNYLAHALTLAESFASHHPDERFIIGIIDRLSAAEADMVGGAEVLPMDALNQPAFEQMKARYNIIELNTACKPYYIDYFFTALNAERVIYLDPDIMVLSRLDRTVDALATFSFVLTPHFVTPIYDDFTLREQVVLSTGTFNLGFFAVRRDAVGRALIDWWRRKLFDECLMDQSRGYFVDQKWMNLSICHFDNYCIDKHLGMNVAHWNLHERRVTPAGNGAYRINDDVPLLLYHFSTYNPDEPESIARGQNRYTFESRPDIVPLFARYRDRLAAHHYAAFRALVPEYGRAMPKRTPPTLKGRAKSKLLRAIQRW